MIRFLLLLIAALPFAAHAERYRVDLVVFLDRGGATTELPKTFTPPDLSKALEIDAATLAGTSIELIPDAGFGMPEVWNRLRGSRRYQPLVKLAWIQNDPTADRALPLHVHSGAVLPYVPDTTATATPTTTVATSPAAPPAVPATYQAIDGTIALRLSRYLFLDADLLYTQPTPDGKLGSYALKEVRKMRRDELHYLDSPKLGIVAKVTKAPATDGGSAARGRMPEPPAATSPVAH